jgi:hypothetical protein
MSYIERREKIMMLMMMMIMVTIRIDCDNSDDEYD